VGLGKGEGGVEGVGGMGVILFSAAINTTTSHIGRVWRVIMDLSHFWLLLHML